MAFSTNGSNTRNWTGKPASITTEANAKAMAAPPMSFFISAIPDDGFKSSPPVSKQTPFPTTVTRGPR